MAQAMAERCGVYYSTGVLEAFAGVGVKAKECMHE